MIAIALAAAASLAAGQGLSNPEVLQPFFAKLAKARAGAATKARPVHILQIGDSHSAGDMISGAWRETLQARYGSGGRGVQPPGRPFDGYLTRGITAAMSPGWTIASDFGKAWGGGGTPLGLSAFSLTSNSDGATMALDADAGEQFDRFVVCGLSAPRAGATIVHFGDQTERLNWNSPTARPECRTLRADSPQSHVDLATEGGPVTLTSWATFADKGGVALSNLGVVGSQLIHFGRTDDQVVAEELRAYDPDLIVIAFGTNEGFAARMSPFEYEAILRSQIARIRRLAGNVPILLWSAPDALTRRSELSDNAPGGDSGPCGAEAQPVPPPLPVASQDAGGGLGAAMARLGTFLGVTSAGEAGTAAPKAATPTYPPGAVVQPLPAHSAADNGGRNPLFPPAALSVIRGIQKRVAAQLHVAYWDWGGRMGRCTAMSWARANPPLMRGDYVHYTKLGGQEVASRLMADLDRAMGAGAR